MKENIFLIGVGLCLAPFAITALIAGAVIGLSGICMALVFVAAGSLAGRMKI